MNTNRNCCFLQVNIVSIRRERALKVCQRGLSNGMMVMPTKRLLSKEGHFLVAVMSAIQKFGFVVEQTVSKTSPSSYPLKLHFSCWRTTHQNAKWSSGRQRAWNGYILIQYTITIRTIDDGSILIMLEKSTPQFITATIVVSKILLKSPRY